MYKILSRILPVLLILASILIISAIPRHYAFLPDWFYCGIFSGIRDSSLSWDELFSAMVHVGVFMLLAFFLANLIIGNDRFRIFQYLLVYIITLLSALGSECFQRFIPDRGFETIDLIMDAIGALIGLGLFYVWNRQTRLKIGKFPVDQGNWSK
jgi:VanZ family protein